MSRFIPGNKRDRMEQSERQLGELSLLTIPGVGRSKARTLVGAGFHSVEDLAAASPEELEDVPGVGPRTARQILAGARRVLEEKRAATGRPTEASIVPHPRAAELSRATADVPSADEPVPDPGRFTDGPAPEVAAGGRSGDDQDPDAEVAAEPMGTGAMAGETAGAEIADEQADHESAETAARSVPSPPKGSYVWNLNQRSFDGPASGNGPQEHALRGAESDDGDPAGGEAESGARSARAAHENREPAEEDVYPADPGDHDVDMETTDETAEEPPDGDREPVETHLTVHIDNSLLAEFDPSLAREFEVVPVKKFGDTLLLAAERALRHGELEDLSRRANMRVQVIPSQIANVHATLHNLYEDNALRSRPKGLGEILIDLGLLTVEQLNQALAQQMRENNPYFHPVLSIDPSVLQLIPEGEARRLNVLPLYRTRDTVLLAASEYPDETTQGAVKKACGLEASFVIVGPSELADAMTHCYRLRQRYELRQMWLGEILISRGLIGRKELDTCLAAQKESRQKLGQLLIEKGFINEDTLYPILAEKLGMEYRRFEPQEVDYQLTYLVSERFAERNLVLPLKVDYDAGTLEVAICDPTNLQVRDMLESVAEAHGQRLKLVLAAPRRLKDSVTYVYNFHRQMEAVTEDLEIETAEQDWEEEDADRHDLVITEDLPKMRRIVNKLLYEAVTAGASDIHIENLETRTQVRFRIDGILHERATPVTKANIQKVISVLKIDSGLNIAERRRAQDGVFKMRIGSDRYIDFRINVHATQFGEDAVIRVLDRSRNLLDLSDLGFAAMIQARYEALVQNPQGLILITGPTGSGKTTTLYSTLQHLNTGDKKIVTAEDPVEYHLDGITQYQVNNFIGNTFAEYTRRFLRKDPDIILVGETRDEDTARACIRAAMTGHLVFSTLHTNDAISVVQRLRDLGVDSSSISDALLCVIQQRLARRNCPDCRKPYQPDLTILREFYPAGEIPADARFVHGTGCSACRNQGLRGRLGLYEFWEVKRETREVIAARADENAIRASAEDNGLTPLVDDALRKVYAGTTTLEELRRVVPVEQIRSYSGYYKVN